MVAYFIGALLWATWRGFQTPLAEANRKVLMFSIAAAVFWPLAVAVTFGASLRFFSIKRLAEDGGYRQ